MVVAALVSAACDTPTQGVPADTHPPVLLAVSFSPATVDVSRGPAETLLTLHVTDEGSGTEWVYVDLQSPGATHFAGCDEPPVLAAGTPHDGSWTCTATLPGGGPSGEWRIGLAQLFDASGGESFSFPGARLAPLTVEGGMDGAGRIAQSQSAHIPSLAKGGAEVWIAPRTVVASDAERMRPGRGRLAYAAADGTAGILARCSALVGWVAATTSEAARCGRGDTGITRR